jgi:4-hydroxyphenylpyruvate dioxygenase-like putative hemolysin
MTSMNTKTINVRLWGQRVSAYAAGGQIWGFDDVAGHYVPVQHLLSQGQIRYVVSRTKVSA